jgi:O-antigen ligase
MSGTRSANILMIFIICSFIYYAKSNFFLKSKIYIAFIILSLIIIFHSIFYSYFSISLERFNVSNYRIDSINDFIVFLNRQEVWPDAWETTYKNITFFGHGPIPAHEIQLMPSQRHFHSLYMTLLFQFGIIGMPIFIYFFYILFLRLARQLSIQKRNSTEYLLIASCIISLCTFLINEIKFEFNRSDSYQQIVWVIFSIYFLAGNNFRKYGI